jgi:hypothetical protein
MKITLGIAIIIFLLQSCSKGDKETLNACKSTNPVEDVTWLRTIKGSLTNCTCEVSIIQGTYDSGTVFYVAITDPLCNGINIPTLFDCNGNMVRTFTMDDYLEFTSLVTPVKVLYRCKKQE